MTGIPEAQVVLIGARGAGKSTVAAGLGLDWVDMDMLVRDQLGFETAAEAFQQVGEPLWRRTEAHVLEALLRDGPPVIAAGGGVAHAHVRRPRLEHLGVEEAVARARQRPGDVAQVARMREHALRVCRLRRCALLCAQPATRERSSLEQRRLRLVALGLSDHRRAPPERRLPPPAPRA